MTKQRHLGLQPPAASVDKAWTPNDIYEALGCDPTIIKRFSEDRRVERKSARVATRDLGDYFSVLANRQPDGGVILVGVANNGEIEGCSALSEAQIDDIERAGTIHCPEARYDVKNIPAYNKNGAPDYFIAIRVYYRPDKLVETVRNEAFTREGSSKRRLTDAEKREIRIKKQEIDYEREDVNLVWPDDFDQSLVREYVINYRAARKITHRQPPEDILSDTRLGRKEGPRFIPNVACSILFAIDPKLIFPGAYIRFMKFAGMTERSGSKYNLIQGKDFWIEGPLPRQIAEAEALIGEEIRKFTRLDSHGKFRTSPEYPKDAWLEAVVNACVHRSYNLKNMVVFVKLFDNKLMVENPGGFYPPTTANTITQIGHNPRNPHLMNALFYFDLVKCAHEGTRRMVESMHAAELPDPEFAEIDQDGNRVRVTLSNDVDHRKDFLDSDVEVPINSDLFRSLDSRERRIVNYLAEHGAMNITQGKEVLGVHWSTAKKVFTSLVTKGVCVTAGKRGGKAHDPSLKFKLKP